MIVELILWYFLQSNSPIFPDPRDRMCFIAGQNCLRAKMTVHVRKEWESGWYLDMKPYVVVNERFVARNAGGEAEAGYDFGPVSVGLYHHSIHALDVNGDGVQLNGITMMWRLN